MEMPVNFLLVSTRETLDDNLLYWLEEKSYKVDLAENEVTAFNKLLKLKYDVLILDINLQGAEEKEILQKFKNVDNDLIILIITETAFIPTTINVLKTEIYGYLTKPIYKNEFLNLVGNALRQKFLKQENEELKNNIEGLITPEIIVGESYEITKVFEMINMVSKNDKCVMIRGELGTGKDLIAHAIHYTSDRKYFPFVTFNCEQVNGSIFESELFRKEKELMSGNDIKNKTKFGLADKGTLYLDNVTSLSVNNQIELLRIIETKTFKRRSDGTEFKSDCRIISSSDKYLEELLSKKIFIDALYYKLNEYTIYVPSLIERTEDIPLIINHYMEKFSKSLNKKICGLSKDAMDYLINYKWERNVSELKNVIERAVMVCEGDTIAKKDLPNFNTGVKIVTESDDKSLAAVEKKYILQVLNENHWNISRSALQLHIDRVTLYNKINKYELRTTADM